MLNIEKLFTYGLKNYISSFESDYLTIANPGSDTIIDSCSYGMIYHSTHIPVPESYKILYISIQGGIPTDVVNNQVIVKPRILLSKRTAIETTNNTPAINDEAPAVIAIADEIIQKLYSAALSTPRKASYYKADGTEIEYWLTKYVASVTAISKRYGSTIEELVNEDIQAFFVSIDTTITTNIIYRR